MKYKYLKGSADYFNGHEDAVLVVKSATSGKIYYLSADYAGREKDIEKAGDIVIAHREPVNVTEVGAEMWFTSPTEALITERGSRYGKFKDGAEIMQELKGVMRDVDGWHNLTPSQREALDMIQHKIGRILNGDPTYDDSWKDIAGYATLIVNELNGEIK
ncbi:hypothetical protein KGB39_gp23 [Salmonella phage Skate]|uniref:Uncharacterized protein n=1 Tax=Salmonella phage Skate TaxID=2234035 RepID=A0A2Z5HS20_9CAUD|nr:hypothetical protein KGB39_gp23 [Salmonella phage Skate]AXC42981.1 hypothetical protein CPT_Skate_023 [Salmonella phage Skate]EKY7761644.1 hypothetical protein [Salmonella enterica]WRQ11889.1 hypothetical protein [Salmonella phage PJN025]